MGRRRRQPPRLRTTALTAAAVGALLSPALAQAKESDEARDARRANRYTAFEFQGIASKELVPSTFLGLDGAFAIGNDNFYFRVGGAVLGAPSFRLASNEVRNLLAYGLADVCAGKAVAVHRIRMCIGAEVGGWAHKWTGYGEALRRRSGHVAGTLKGDYQYAFTDRFGLLFGVGVSIPAVGPQFRGRDQFGRPTPILIPGPVAGSLRIGASFRFG